MAVIFTRHQQLCPCRETPSLGAQNSRSVGFVWEIRTMLCSKFRTCLDVVALVLVGVDGVIHQSPAHPSQVQGHHRRPVARPGRRGVPQQCPPVESQPQERLRLQQTQSHPIYRSVTHNFSPWKSTNPSEPNPQTNYRTPQ